MKVLIFSLLLVLVAGAPNHQPETFHSTYLATRYLPAGQEFRLPIREEVPEVVYGVPDNGPTTEIQEETTEIQATTTEASTESSTEKELDEIKDDVEFVNQGVYYIYHPDGLLQRVVYSKRSEEMGYTAQLKYQDVQPITDPIYTYDPKTFAFTQIKA